MRAILSFAATVVLVVLASVASTHCNGPSGPGSAPSPLTVVAFAPRGATDDRQPFVRVRFDRPVVTPESVGIPLDTPPVELEPATPVTVRWEDRQTLTLQPQAPLRASTRYRVRLSGELAGRTGGAETTFVVLPLAVDELVLGSEPDALPADLRFALRFNQEVFPAEVTAHCALVDERGWAVPLLVAGPADPSRLVALTAAQRLPLGQRFELRCSELRGAGGDTPMTAPFARSLATHARFRVVGVAPDDEEGEVAPEDVPLVLTFSTAVSWEELQAALSLEPKAEGLTYGYLNDDGREFSVRIDLAPSTTYTIRLADTLADLHGQRLEGPREWRLRTGRSRPWISFETGIYAVEAKQGGAYPIWTRNLSKVQVKCASVPRAAIVRLLTSEMNYDPWVYASDEAIDWAGLGLAPREHALTVRSKPDEWHLEEVALGAMCGGSGPRGLYLAQITTPEAPPADTEWGYQKPERVLANVTDLGLLLKVGSSSGLVWVTRLSTGAPVAGADVEIWTTDGRKAFVGRTGTDGLLRVPGAEELLRAPGDRKDVEGAPSMEYDSWRARRVIAVVSKGRDMAVVDGNWSNGIQIWNFGVAQDYRTGAPRFRGFVLSDRGIYRPGETAHFKGWLREVALGQSPTTPRGVSVEVSVEDARGTTLSTETLPLSAFGGFALDVRVPDGAPLGDWRVLARVGPQTFVESFVVEEFRAVTFELGLTAGERHTRLGRALGFALDARYLFGMPVAGAAVRWNVQRRPHPLRFDGFRDYTFADEGLSGTPWWWWADDDANLEFVASGEGETDEEGRLAFTVQDPRTGLTASHDYVVQATVEDETGETVAKRVAVTAHATARYLGLHAQECVQAVGMPFAVSTVAVAPDGTRVAGKASLEWIRQRVVCAYTESGHRAYPSCATKHETVWSRPIDIPATGNGSERILPSEPGEYVVRIVGDDGEGNRIAASSWVWVLGKGEAFWSGDESDRMSLVASKSEYLPGETARLVPRSSVGGGTTLVTLERSGIVDAFVTSLAGGEGLDLAVARDWAPNVFATVAMVKGRTGKGDRFRPRFQMGVVDLKVSAEDRRLAVKVETARATYEPGEEVTGRIRVTSGGAPVAAEVAFSAADEGVLQLVAYKTPDPMARFYEPWGLGVDNATNWNRIARLADPSVPDPDEGGDSGSSGQQRVRSRFVASAFWAPSLLTGADGEVTFRFPAPDNLTAFRLMAVAVDDGDRFGSGEARVTVNQPLMAQPLLPRFVSEGDRLEVGVSARNLTGAAGEARVTAVAEGVRLTTGEGRVALEEGGSGIVRFGAHVPEGVETARFTFTAALGAHDDAVEVTLPVRRPLAIESLAVGRGRVDGDVTLALDWPDATVADASRVEVVVDRAGLAELGPALRELVEYPYGCLEQTLSRLVPLLKVEDLAKSLDMESLRGPRLARFIEAGLQKVVRHQHEDGHFSLWPGSATHPHLTVYAIYGLLEAKRAGVAVDEAALAKALDAARRAANAPNAALAGGDGATAAMAAYVLAEAGQPDPGLVGRLLEARRGLPLYGRAFLLSAMPLSGARAEDVATVRRELLASVEREGGAALVRESAALREYMSSDVRTTAIVLSALLRTAGDAATEAGPVVDELVEGLRRSQRRTGGWYTTQESLFALVALADYARRDAEGVREVTVLLEDRTLAQRRLRGHEVLSVGLPLEGLQPGDLRIETDGSARYSARLVLARRDDGGTPVARGFGVVREYLASASDVPVGALHVGDLVRIRVTVRTDERRDYVALVDPLPAGLEPVNTRLATSETVDATEESDPWGHRWSYRELRDDRVLAFADRMEKGVLTLEYLARATTPGRFTAAPARAEAMYDPDVFGRTLAETIEVQP